VFYFTRNHAWNRNKIISAAEVHQHCRVIISPRSQCIRQCLLVGLSISLSNFSIDFTKPCRITDYILLWEETC